MLYTLRLSYQFNTEVVPFACLYVFRQAGPPQRVDYLAPRWVVALSALSVFPKDTATRFRIDSRTKVSQPFDY